MTEKYLVEVDGEGTYWYAGTGTPRRLHRLNGPAIEWADGTLMWYQNGQRHRADGPAITRPDGYQAWWQNDQLHRVDGPAVIDEDGAKEYWLDGVQHTEESWRAATQPAAEMTVAEIEAALGKRIKIVK